MTQATEVLPVAILLTRFNFNPSNHIFDKLWDEIIYPSPNFNGYTVEVWEWINNFIPYFTRHVIMYPC